MSNLMFLVTTSIMYIQNHIGRTEYSISQDSLSLGSPDYKLLLQMMVYIHIDFTKKTLILI